MLGVTTSSIILREQGGSVSYDCLLDSRMRARWHPSSLLVLPGGIDSAIVTLSILEVMHPPRIALGFLLADGFASSFRYFLETPTQATDQP